MPLAVLALTAGAFGIGTTEFIIMGLLLQVAAEMHVSTPVAGLPAVPGAPALAPAETPISASAVR